MRSLLAALLIATTFSTPAWASGSKLHAEWENFKAHRAFHHLSVDGQKAFADILKAHDLLQAGKTDPAVPLLYDAQKRLAAAQKADQRFKAAESQLQPAPQHQADANHKATEGTVDWLPLGGEFIVSESLSPEKKAAVATANTQLKSGDSKQAAQTMQVVGVDADFIIALAPLQPTIGALNRANIFTEGRQPTQALSALDDILDSLVFVSENSIIQNDPAAGTSAPSK
ncbi:YfdX family protein [Swingsia samuiensis]|uniref:YfdX family protein n=1 Tax=Swingsia samuiensis TaxID=1293412 RepID=A0A4Y6UKX4_9PROT|nr:YfdX family protein [Swingsia samuiensis]QDH17724.1 YfdX family protein [Swingsia samuiensis]